ncbi:MAG: multidrug efflux SMR transporter [Pseudomonadota bacterium]|nr:multidrug efflux SMR transporter [Pseudomonadota bacterium]
MAWILLLIAGVMEVGWATCLKLSHGFSKVGYSVLTVIGMLISFGFLAQAMKTLPLGTAYGIWTGIGALGAVVVGLVFFKEPVTAWRMFFAAMLLIGIVGLKFTSHS